MTMLNTDQAAKYLFGEDGKSSTLNQWRHRKQGPKFRKVGKLVRYAQTDLDAYLAERTHSGTSHTGAQSY